MHIVAEGQAFIGHTGTIAGIAFSPDGSRVLTGAHEPQEFDRDAIVWDVPSGNLRMRLHGNQVGVFSVAYSSDGRSVATGGGGAMKGSHWVYDNVVRLWNEEGQECGNIADDFFMINALAFSPDSKCLLTGSKNMSSASPAGDGSCIRLWNASSRCEIRRFGTYSSNVQSVAFSPDGKYALAGCAGFGFGADRPSPAATLRTADADNSLQSDKNLLNRVLDVARSYASTPGQRARSVDLYDRTLRMWEVETGKELDMFDHGEWINSVSFSPDGDLVLSAGSTVLLWSTSSGKRIQQIGGAEARFAHCAAFSPDGRHVAVGLGDRYDPGSAYRNCFLILYEVATGVEIARWHHAYPVTALAFSPSGEVIIAGGERGEIHLWRLVANALAASMSPNER